VEVEPNLKRKKNQSTNHREGMSYSSSFLPLPQSSSDVSMSCSYVCNASADSLFPKLEETSVSKPGRKPLFSTDRFDSHFKDSKTLMNE